MILLMLLESGIAAVFANDGAALVVTPIVVHFLQKNGVEEKVPFLLATELMADAASVPFVVSNLVNVVSATYFHISFLSHARVTFLPYVVSTLTTIGVVFLLYGRELKGSYLIGGEEV
ncbi:hypothetical protein HS1genome_1809 [Sulfodiicoccus acidiphilus]|uniref:Citrate transporter-like domain-containing protein n=1 Tax=Sulfodiicoccus acidiphilus TaxID=1670455 RepID=A0A348B5G8_9CREN|nr:hypothetical protein HS1genome_1809 [Sulfodiicoccus acidiphilus]GGT98662.1 hypothetical protein GCM10007116_15100 [Sulfodiicoccus acidiphilus]